MSLPTIAAAALSIDGATLAVGSCGAEVILFDIESGQPVGEPLLALAGEDRTVVKVRFFERDDRTLLVGWSFHHGKIFPMKLALWDVATPTPELIAVDEEIDELRLAGLWAHPDGYLALTKDDGTVELIDPLVFDTESGEFGSVQTFIGHSVPPAVISFSSDGTLMLTAQSDSTRLWDVESGEQIGLSFGAQMFAQMALDGNSFASVPADGGPIFVWNTDPDFWEEQACFSAGRNLTRAEWAKYLPVDEPYRATCDRWPLPGVVAPLLGFGGW